MKKSILAIIMVLALVLSFAACGAKTEPENTEPDATVADTTDEVADMPTEATSEDAEEPTEATSEDAEEPTEATSEDAEETTEAAAKMPETKEEIVEYFNTASNKVKSDAKSVTRASSVNSLNGSIEAPNAIKVAAKVVGGIDKFVGDQLAKNSKGSETWDKAGIKSYYPVEGETYASKLTAADVSKATCEEKDGKYVITIVTVADGKSGSYVHGSGHAPKAFNVILPGVINENIPGFAKSMIGETAMNYPASTAKITVDPATGNIESATYVLCWTINFGDNIVLPFKTTDEFNGYKY